MSEQGVRLRFEGAVMEEVVMEVVRASTILYYY
jgi:hypothetical protein